MSHPDGDPPRRGFDFDILVDYAGFLVAVLLIVSITWLFLLNPIHFGLEPNTHLVHEVLAAGVFDAVLAVIVGFIFLLWRHPPKRLFWDGLMLIIFASLCMGSCGVTVVLLNYWSQPK